jgi:glycosyltransferase involved in cell wall biosynthesis
MHEEILPRVIFSPGKLALSLAAGLRQSGVEVTLYSPGPVPTLVRNVTADLSYFEHELAGRGDSYLDLLKKHPLTFVTLARQVQSEIVARAYADANRGELDVVHVYTNEEDIALPFAGLCAKPVVFTHHDPFNFLVKYKNVFPKYKHLNWISMSLAQRRGMPADTNWVGNVYHGLDARELQLSSVPADRVLAYLGRIIEPKGVHLAIAAVKAWNAAAAPEERYILRIAGKHYAGTKDQYWQERIVPELRDDIEYVGFVRTAAEKQAFLGNAHALLVPSLFEEPFGMVMIEALACGTPVIGLDSGAIPEVVRDGVTGFVVGKVMRQAVNAKSGQPERRVDDERTAAVLVETLGRIGTIDRRACRADFEARFTLERMVAEHLAVYERVAAIGGN